MNDMQVNLVSTVSIQDFLAWLKQQDDFKLTVYCDVNVAKNVAVILCPEDYASLQFYWKEQV